MSVDLLDMEIHVWTPMKPGDPCLAMIGNGPVLFRGATPLAVKRQADEWRKAERAKFLARQANAADKARIAANREGRE